MESPKNPRFRGRSDAGKRAETLAKQGISAREIARLTGLSLVAAFKIRAAVKVSYTSNKGHSI